jgi:RHS repeat-associated protein
MQLTSDGTYDYTYDAEGRLNQQRARATGGITRYTWSDAGRLTSIVAPNGATSTYRYDALGRRLEVNENGTIRRFVYSGWNLRNEFDGANALRATYVAGLFPDSVYEIVRDGTRYYPLFDGVGSVTALTDATGAAVGHVRYSAFGVPQSSGATENAVSFTGHQFDAATGLFYARARYYDPTLGRFLSEDPVLSLNRYAYVANDPTNQVDPTGANATAEKIGIGIGAGVTAVKFAVHYSQGKECEAMIDLFQFMTIVSSGGVGLAINALGESALLGAAVSGYYELIGLGACN